MNRIYSVESVYRETDKIVYVEPKKDGMMEVE